MIELFGKTNSWPEAYFQRFKYRVKKKNIIRVE